MILKSPSSGVTIEGAKGVRSNLFVHESTVGPIINTYTAYDSRGIEAETGWFDVMNFRHFYASDVPYMGVASGKSLYGMLIEKQTGGDNNYGIVLNGDGSGADIVFGYNKETRLYGNQGNFIIDTSGNVGIGTTDPSYPLEMASGAHVTIGGVWTDASSREYKENIRVLSIEKALAALKGLKPVEFNFKVDKEERHVGFIAEEVPELVAMNDRKSLSPMDIIAVVTRVVKEQQKIIEKQEREIEELKARIQRLEAKNLIAKKIIE